MEGILDVTSATWDAQVLEPEDLVMVIFWAEWCEPSKKMIPMLEELARKYSRQVKIVKLNIEENVDIGYTYKVSIIPTIMFFIDGQKKREMITSVPQEQLESAIIELS